MPGSGPIEDEVELFVSSSEAGHDNAAPVCASRSEYIKKVTDAKAIEDFLRQQTRRRRARYLLRNIFYSFGLWAYFAFMMCCAFAIAWGIGRGDNAVHGDVAVGATVFFTELLFMLLALIVIPFVEHYCSNPFKRVKYGARSIALMTAYLGVTMTIVVALLGGRMASIDFPVAWAHHRRGES